MRRLSIGSVLLLVLFLAACDSGSDEGRSESELFVGSWTLTRVEDDGGDRTALVQAAGQFSATFGSDKEYELVFDPAAAGANQTLANSYTVTEITNVLTLNATTPGTQQPLPLAVTYSFTNDDRVVLTIPSMIVALVTFAGFEAFEDLAGDVELTLSRRN